MKAFITKLRNNIKKKSKQSKSPEQQFDLTAKYVYITYQPCDIDWLYICFLSGCKYIRENIYL